MEHSKSIPHSWSLNDIGLAAEPTARGLLMFELDPRDPKELAFALLKAVRRSGLTLAEICERLDEQYGVKLTQSDLSHAINRDAIRFQRALQLLAVCGERKLKIRVE